MRCTATTRAGNQCAADSVKGAVVCRMHGGSAPQVRAAAARRLALGELEAEVERERRRRNGLGVPIDVDPAEAMLAMVGESAGNVAVLRRQVQRLQAEVVDPVDEFDEDGVLVSARLGGGIAGRVDRDNWRGAPHVLVEMYNDERDRLVRYCKMCRDAGVDERRVAIAEEQGRQIADVLTAAVRGLLEAAARELGVDVAVLARVEREEAPGIVRHVIEARVLGGAT